MGDIISDYFRPGRAILLVAALLLASMGLQFYILPQVLDPMISGDMFEGTVVGVILIFNYTLTTLGFLFLLMEYFNMKNRVKTYVRLTQGGLPSESLERKTLAEPSQPLVELSKTEKPVRKGLLSGLIKGGKKEEALKKVKEPRPKGPGILSFLKGKPKLGGEPVKTPKPRSGLSLAGILKRSPKPGEEKPKTEKPKEQKPGLLSRFAQKKKEEPKKEEKVIKKITVDALALPQEKPAPAIDPLKEPILEPIKAPVIEPLKAPEVIIKKTPEPVASPTEQTQAPASKPSVAIADLLSGMNALPKPKDEVTGQFIKLKPMGEVGEDKPPAKAEQTKKAADLLVAAAEEHREGEAKSNTVEAKSPEKPVALPPITIPKAPEPTPINIEDSEFLKVLTDLRSVVDEMKSKKKVN